MLSASLVGLLVSLAAYTGPVSSLPINEASELPGQDAPINDRALKTDYTPLPNRPTAAHLPKRTTMGSTRTRPHIAATARPIKKRAGIDPEVYLTSIESLYSAFTATSDSLLAAEISSFIASNTPTGVDAEAFQTSLISVMSGAANEVADFESAAVIQVGSIFGGDSNDDVTSLSGVISTDDGTTYWSLPNYVSTWGSMDGLARESWRSKNNYVGTFTDTEAETFSTGVMVRAPNSTTWWRSDVFVATMASLSTIDSGMAQLSWTQNNVWSGFDRTTSSVGTAAGGVETRAGVGAQMNTVAGAHSSPDPTSVQSGNTVLTQASNGGASYPANSQLITNVMAGNLGVATSNAIPQFTTNEAGVTIIAASQPAAGNAAATGLTPGTLASCPTSTGVNGVYVACNRGGDPALAMEATGNPVTSAGGTAAAAGQTSLPASSNCTLAACSAMAEPYTSPGVTST